MQFFDEQVFVMLLVFSVSCLRCVAEIVIWATSFIPKQ